MFWLGACLQVLCYTWLAEAEETWLILPVVICLSQRLSHACLRINLYTVNLPMALYNSYCLLDGHSLHG